MPASARRRLVEEQDGGWWSHQRRRPGRAAARRRTARARSPTRASEQVETHPCGLPLLQSRKHSRRARWATVSSNKVPSWATTVHLVASGRAAARRRPSSQTFVTLSRPLSSASRRLPAAPQSTVTCPTAPRRTHYQELEFRRRAELRLIQMIWRAASTVRSSTFEAASADAAFGSRTTASASSRPCLISDTV